MTMNTPDLEEYEKSLAFTVPLESDSGDGAG